MERSVSIYGSSSVLRGVQLKIGEKFKPPTKVTLPVGWKTRDPSKILSLTYDFSLEEDVIEKAIAEKLAIEQLENAQKAKEEEEMNLQLSMPVIASMGDILQPTTATSGTNTQSESKEAFNYKDFENNGDTPFELVELQSINSMDALKSVLQPELKSEVSSSPVVTANNTIQNTQITNTDHANTPNGHINPQSNTTLAGNPLGNMTTTGVPSQVPYSSPNINPPVSSNSPFLHTALPSNHAQHLVNPIHQLNAGSDLPSASGINIPVSQQQNSSSSSTNNTALPGERRIHLPGALRVLPGPPPSRPLPQRPPPRRPGSMPSESIPDGAPSVSNQKRPIPKPRSKLPPIKNDPDVPPVPPKKSQIKTQVYKNQNNPIPKDEKHLKRYASPLPPISPPMTPSSTPDPFLALSLEESQFVNKLSAMGFPAQIVARAVKNIGCKEREVVDFLILVGEMCGKGYPEGQVEMVLKECDSNKEKAETFLALLTQFKELGFQEEKIFNALKESECDSNKTLDILTCAG